MVGVKLWENGIDLGGITWDTNTWTELGSENKWVFDSILSIDDFRP